MKSMIFALAVFATTNSVCAQEASPEIQAMSAKIMLEISQGLQCSTASIKLAKENEALKAQIKQLETKSGSPADAK